MSFRSLLSQATGVYTLMFRRDYVAALLLGSHRFDTPLWLVLITVSPHVYLLLAFIVL